MVGAYYFMRDLIVSRVRFWARTFGAGTATSH